MVVRLAIAVVRTRINTVLATVGILGLAAIIGLPIVAVLFGLGMLLKGSGLPAGLQEAIGLVVGWGLLLVLVVAFGQYLIDW